MAVAGPVALDAPPRRHRIGPRFAGRLITAGSLQREQAVIVPRGRRPDSRDRTDVLAATAQQPRRWLSASLWPSAVSANPQGGPLAPAPSPEESRQKPNELLKPAWIA